MSERFLSAGLLGLFTLLCLPAAQRAAGPREQVRLTLSGASAERYEGEVVFRCDAALVNDTDAVLTVRSNFSSAFDGLHLVVLGPDGRRLVQQSYSRHQSPSSPDGRLFPLGRGANRKTL